ncbi:EamA family transporter [Maribacter sp. 2210JD10-5]|uniref:EamA family transporter n=1 Tax=Maribacter sp. 2210JD10-5 TaxID=3386272 RepID=UPI0039BC8B6E
MLYLALSVLFSSLIFVIFKLFNTYGVQTLYAIITNYFVACSVGLLVYNGDIKLAEIPSKNWFLGALALGILFILVFNVMARTSQTLGVSVASVATKMSFVMPVIFGVILYKEVVEPIKIVGILVAIAAVYLASLKTSTIKFHVSMLLLPLLVFLGSGAIDTAIKFFQERLVPQEEFSIFSATVFAAAATTGIVFIAINSFKKPLKKNYKNVLGGIVLGVPNFFSIFFLLKALQFEGLTSAAIFTLNNVAIVMVSTLFGILFFREKLSLKNWTGVALAVVSILLVALF